MFCPDPAPSALPSRISVLFDCTPGESDTIEQVLANHLASCQADQRPQPWLLYIQGHRSRDYATLAKTKNSPLLFFPANSPHIWTDLIQLCQASLGQLTGQPGRIIDFYFRAPAALAFQIGRLASSRQGANRVFQYVYNQSGYELVYDNGLGPY